MSKYFIADCHFNHEALVLKFPRRNPTTNELFTSAEEHDDYLLDEINDAVGRHDDLFILGDFCGGGSPYRYRRRINCRHVHLIRGNHDKFRESTDVFGHCPKAWTVKLRYPGYLHPLPTVLSHNPQAFWDGSHRGWGHLYGHTHGMREETLDAWLGKQRRSMDVGVDSLLRRYGSYRPLSEEFLFDFFRRREGHDQPSFYPNNIQRHIKSNTVNHSEVRTTGPDNA